MVQRCRTGRLTDRRALLGRPLAAAAALAAVGVGPPTAWAGAEFCSYEPAVTVQVGGATVAVQVWLGVPVAARAELDPAATNRSIRAQVDDQPGPDGSYGVTVWVTVAARGGASFPVAMALAVPAQQARSPQVAGQAGAELDNRIRVRPR